MALQPGTLFVTERTQHSNAVFICVNGALSGSYNPTLTASTLTANSAWIGRTAYFFVSGSKSKQELLDVLVLPVVLSDPFRFWFFLALLKEPFNFLNNCVSHAVPRRHELEP
jgi:hypothetical protein